jgi:hypothetical protein
MKIQRITVAVDFAFDENSGPWNQVVNEPFNSISELPETVHLEMRDRVYDMVTQESYHIVKAEVIDAP